MFHLDVLQDMSREVWWMGGKDQRSAKTLFTWADGGYPKWRGTQCIIWMSTCKNVSFKCITLSVYASVCYLHYGTI